MKRVFYILWCAIFGVIAVAIIAASIAEVASHIGSGAVNGKAVAELFFLLVIALIFARWSFVLGKRALTVV